MPRTLSSNAHNIRGYKTPTIAAEGQIANPLSIGAVRQPFLLFKGNTKSMKIISIGMVGIAIQMPDYVPLKIILKRRIRKPF